MTPASDAVASAGDEHDSPTDTHGRTLAESPLSTLTTSRVASRVRARPELMPDWVWQPFMSWYDLSITSLSPTWRRSTILMWGAWMSTSAGMC